MKFLAILIATGTFFKFKYFYFCLCRKRNGSGSFRGAYESDEEIAYVGLGINGYVWYPTVCCQQCCGADPLLLPHPTLPRKRRRFNLEWLRLRNEFPGAPWQHKFKKFSSTNLALPVGTIFYLHFRILYASEHEHEKENKKFYRKILQCCCEYLAWFEFIGSVALEPDPILFYILCYC